MVCLQESARVARAGARGAGRGGPRGYHCHWHGHKGLLGRGGLPLLKATALAESPELQAGCRSTSRRGLWRWRRRGPGAGVGVRAERRQGLRRRRCSSSPSSRRGSGASALEGRGRWSCAATSTSRSPTPTCIRLTGPGRMVGQLPEERALIGKLLGHGPGRRGALRGAPSRTTATLYTWWAPWRNMRAAQHRLAHRLRAGQPGPGLARHAWRGRSREIGTSDHAPVIADF